MDISKYDPWVFKSLDSGDLNQYLKGMKVLHLDDSLMKWCLICFYRIFAPLQQNFIYK